MKKIFGILFALAIFSSNCFAMTFSQPVKIGEVSYNGSPTGGVEIVGATSKKNYSTSKNSAYYGKGIALFGKSLYFYFNDEYFRQNFNGYTTELTKKVSRFGGTDVKNSVPIFTLEGKTDIYQIKNDGGIELYLAQTETGAGGTIQVFGTTKEGKWVKYFDTADAVKNFGIPRDEWFSGFFTFGDTIVIQYRPQHSRNNSELRYKWDEAAQWFGVENQTNEDLRAYLRNGSSKFFGIPAGTGLGFLIDRKAILAEKTSDGCIITFRTIHTDSNRKPEKVSSGFAMYAYNFQTKKIYRKKYDDKGVETWEYVDPNKSHTILLIAEAAYYFAYGKHFFNPPISLRARDLK